MLDTELAKKLVKKCLERGADEAEAYGQSRRILSIRLRNGEVETVQESASQGVGLRVFVKGSLGFASSNDFADKALEEAVSSAVRFARHTTPDPNNILPEDPAVTQVEGLYDPALPGVKIEDGILLAKAVEEKALAHSGITKSAGASFRRSDEETVLANSHGLAKSYRESGFGYGG